MRVILLDETGIKIITSTKKQMYLTLNEVQMFIREEYTIDKDNVLHLNGHTLPLSEKDIEGFQNTYEYIRSHFEDTK